MDSTYALDSNCEISVPNLQKYFYINKKQEDFFNYIYEESFVSGNNLNVLLTGPHGCGKSEICKIYASKRKLKFFETNCSLYREPRDFFGIKGAKSGNTYFQKTGFLKALGTENCVILLDEINRLVPSVANSLYEILDDRRQIYFDEVGEVNVAKGVVIFATKNVGLRYTGTMPSDLSLIDRFNPILEVDFLPEEEEIKVLTERTKISELDARLLVKFAWNVRAKAKETGSFLRNTISTRTLINCANMFSKIGKDAIDYCILPLYSKDGGNDSERTQVILIKQMIYGDLVNDDIQNIQEDDGEQ